MGWLKSLDLLSIRHLGNNFVLLNLKNLFILFQILKEFTHSILPGIFFDNYLQSIAFGMYVIMKYPECKLKPHKMLESCKFCSKYFKLEFVNKILFHALSIFIIQDVVLVNFIEQ